MTYNKAIMLLQQEIDSPGTVFYQDLRTAQTKGIEALEYCRIIRQFPHLAEEISLPPDSED